VAYSLVERNPGTPARLARRVPSARLLYIVRAPLLEKPLNPEPVHLDRPAAIGPAARH
jgi:hypothetical protein